MRDPCFRPSESAKESFFANPLYAFLFASFGVQGQSFAFEYLTVKEKYSVEDSSRIVERIASLSQEATARIKAEAEKGDEVARPLFFYLTQT